MCFVLLGILEFIISRVVDVDSFQSSIMLLIPSGGVTLWTWKDMSDLDESSLENRSMVKALANVVLTSSDMRYSFGYLSTKLKTRHQCKFQPKTREYPFGFGLVPFSA